MNLLLRHVRWWSDGREGRGDLRVRRGVVTEMGAGLAPARGERALSLDGHLALPGLVNCHDHLDLDLLPHLGTPPYRNMYEWAERIYRPDDPPIRDVLEVRLRDRLWWGGARNLIAGVTTVMNHDPYHGRWFGSRFPVRVLKRYGWSHSLGFGQDLKSDFRRSRGPYFIHAAEGVDARAAVELDRLGEMGLVTERTVVVHGVGLTPDQRETMVQAGCGLVWCPSSNLRLYGETAPVAELKGRIRIGLGTDSTISGTPHLLDELRTAARTGQVHGDELLRMVTCDAADLLRLDRGRGRLRAGGLADVVVMPDRGGPPHETLLGTAPEDVALVTVGGRPRVAAPELAAGLGLGDANARVAGAPKWLYFDVGRLRRRIDDATARVGAASNPLWMTLEAGGAS